MPCARSDPTEHGQTRRRLGHRLRREDDHSRGAQTPGVRTGRGGVSNPAKVGLEAAEICGLAGDNRRQQRSDSGNTGIVATDDVDSLIALRPDAVVHYG